MNIHYMLQKVDSSRKRIVRQILSLRYCILVNIPFLMIVKLIIVIDQDVSTLHTIWASMLLRQDVSENK